MNRMDLRFVWNCQDHSSCSTSIQFDSIHCISIRCHFCIVLSPPNEPKPEWCSFYWKRASHCTEIAFVLHLLSKYVCISYWFSYAAASLFIVCRSQRCANMSQELGFPWWNTIHSIPEKRDFVISFDIFI